MNNNAPLVCLLLAMTSFGQKDFKDYLDIDITTTTSTATTTTPLTTEEPTTSTTEEPTTSPPKTTTTLATPEASASSEETKTTTDTNFTIKIQPSIYLLVEEQVNRSFEKLEKKLTD
jgi:hypothetical protein